jgi:predicted ATPase/Tfp pilus assembly protein PilF
VLEEELGDEPTPETTELYRRIRAGALEVPPRPQPPGNLPAQSEPVIGRRAELDKVEAMLEDPACRLLTLSGPGGVGKTRLALQAAADLADEFEHGAFWVPLASISDPALVLATIAHTLGIEEGSGAARRDALRTALRDREILLILDNFEHLLAASPVVSDLLEAAPRLRVLVTSRASLRVRSEWVYPVPPLTLPPLDDPALPEVVSRFSAAAMFAERAQLVRPDFAITDANARTVAEICHRLEGLPLAIELAAARLNMMPVQALLARLEHRLGILTGGPRDLSERQQTLRATLAWSHDLLSEPQRELLRKLAVFAGGCTLEAAEAVCGPDEDWQAALYTEAGVLEGLSSLVDNSLVLREEMPGEGGAGTVRFRMLETVREYALEQLEKAGETERVRQRHAEYFVTLAQQAEPQLRGPEQRVWLDLLETEHDNLRAVLGWAVAGGSDRALELGVRLGGYLWRFWRVRGYLTEGRKWLDELLAAPGQASPAARAEAFRGDGVLTFTQGDLKRAAELCEQGLALYTEIEDNEGSAGVLNTLANTRREQGNYDSAMGLYERSLSLYRALGDKVGISVSLNNLCPILHTRGELVRAAALYEESLELRRSAGDTVGIAYTLDKLAEVLRDRGELDRAAAICEESLVMRRQIGDKHGRTLALVTLGMIYHEQGDDTRAEPLFTESLALCRDLGESWGVATAQNNLASVALERCEYETARDLWEESAQLYRENGDNRGVATCLSGLGQVAYGQGEYERARTLHEESLGISRVLGDVRAIADELNWLGNVLVRLGEHEGAADLFAESAHTCLAMGEKRILVRCFAGLGTLFALRGDPARSATFWGTAESLREATGLHLPPRERASWDEELGRARAMTGEQAWAEAWDVGRAMPVEDAVALAEESGGDA